MSDFDKQVVYINSDNITDFYSGKIIIDKDVILGTHINMADGSTFVEESAEYILNMIQPMPLYLDTDALSTDERKRLYKQLLNGLYGTMVVQSDTSVIK